MFRARTVTSAFFITLATANPSWASDARSISLGGSVIANGQGAYGALENPASLMAMKRREESVHIHFGFSGEIRDSGSTIDTLTDEANEDLISDIETEIDALSNRTVQCDPIFGAAEDVCVDNTQPLSDLATRILDIIDLVDDESLEAQLEGNFGMAFTRPTYPFAISFSAIGTGAGTPSISDGDRDYIQEFANLLDEDSLTLGEVSNSTYLEVNELGIPLGVQQPEDVLQSEGAGNALIRTQMNISFASTFVIGGHAVDIGLTPKFSSLRAYNIEANVADEFQDNTDSLADRFEDSEVTESSFTTDVGMSMALSQVPIRIAAVLRNVIPESITTTDGFEFKTTPQLLLGGHYQAGMVSLTADLALNEAKLDNFRTQKVALGAEIDTRFFALRGGINHDSARSNNATSLSLGLGLGPLQVGARLTDTDALQAGAQLSYSFR